MLIRLSKANQSFGILQPSKQLHTKPRSESARAKVFLYMEVSGVGRRLKPSLANFSDTFHTKCLRRVKRIVWPHKITNQDLFTMELASPRTQNGGKRPA